jgi:predicted dehydrogenase
MSARQEASDGSERLVAVVGCGYWGRNYVRILHELPGVRLGGIAERDPERREAIRGLAGGAPVVGGLEELLGCEPGISAVIVATEASAHAANIRLALERGCHVLAEKPLTLESAAAEALCRLAEERGCVLMVGHTFLFNNAVRLVRRLIREGRLGRIYYLQATRTHLGPIREDVNAIWDLAAHDVAIFNYLLGEEPVSVSAVGAAYLRPDREDVAFITLRYPEHRVGHIHISWIDSNKERRLTVVGDSARVVFDDLNNLEKVRIFEKGIAVHRDVDNFGEFQYLLRDGDIISPKVPMREPLKLQVEEFLAAIGGEAPPLSDGWMGLAVVRILEGVQASIAANGAPIPLGG